jgi:hypothetical protein
MVVQLVGPGNAPPACHLISVNLGRRLAADRLFALALPGRRAVAERKKRRDKLPHFPWR